jgi:HAD superfamily hydrolase (TIGR01457 family)
MLPTVDRAFKGYIFDLDGTIWLTGDLIPGARETVAALRARGSRVVFLTNNSDGTQAMFAEQLTGMGIETGPEEVISASYVMARYLQKEAPHSRCYVVGPEPLREELVSAGLILRDRPGDVDYVVMGIDRDITYHKFQTAFAAIRAGARFYATNPDPYIPTPDGDLIDIGAFIAALETAIGRKLDLIVGKPNPIIVREALKTLALPPQDCLLVGDQLGTDVLAGKNAGVPMALLLRDPRVVERLAGWEHPPDFGLEKLVDLIVPEGDAAHA